MRVIISIIENNMTTVINNSGESESSGAGLIIGAIIAIVLIALFFMYGLPAIRSTGGEKNTTDINVNIPNPVGNGETPNGQ